MALYYPPLKGSKGEKASDWPTGVIPSNLANAIASAVYVGKESIYDSNTGWLIMDGKGVAAGPENTNLQPFDQRVGFKSKEPLTITVKKSGGVYTPQPDEIFSKSWFDKNKNWVIPVGLGLVLILFNKN